MAEPRGERPAMRAYGVDTPDWEALPWSWAAARLVPNKSYWLVTASATGRPHAFPVWGVWDDDEHRFMFSCSPTARKAANLRANPQVTVAVDDTEECVTVEGRAEPVTDDDRIRTWSDRYLAKYQAVEPTLDHAFIAANLVVEVAPERAFGLIEDASVFATRATRWTFDV